MSLALALQGAASGTPPNTVLIILGVLALLALVVLNLRFFRNIFEVITAPTASLKFHGQEDTFFYSIILVLLGGLIATMIMVAKYDAITQSFDKYASATAKTLAQSNGNANYRDIAETQARNRLNSTFDFRVMQNLLLIPFVLLPLWIIFGFFTFLFSKMFQGGATAGNLLGTTAYASFFFSIGLGLAAVFIVEAIAATASGSSPMPDVMGIIGLVLMAYGAVLFLIGTAQATEISTGQMIGIVIFLLVVFGGAGYGLYHAGQTHFAVFAQSIKNFNPATTPIG